MPLAFKLPTTSHLALQDFLSCSTHPSLCQSATSHRVSVRQSLKEYKRLPESSRASHLNDILIALNGYVPYLLAIDAGISGSKVAGDEVQVNLEKEIEVEWRATLTATVPGREPARVKLKSFEYEVLFSLSTLAVTHYLLARSHLHSLYSSVFPTLEQRVAAISSARKQFLESSSIYTFLASRANQLASLPPVPDISPSMLEALASLSRAEATMAAILKDDPYPAAVVQDRNANDKEWMIKAPEIPKVRVHLFSRLCIAAADHANKAFAVLSRSREVTGSLVKYAEDFKKFARGKACRLLAIDAEMSGMTGEGIAWLRAANRELGFANPGSQDKAKDNVFSKFKKDWSERREDKKVERGVDWGSDAGRLEEGRVVDMLMTKWTKMNDTVNVQIIPPSEPLLAKLPSGREFDTTSPWIPPNLDEIELPRLRAPPEPTEELYQATEDDSDDDDGGAQKSDPVGAFPGTGSAYSKPSNYF